MLDLPRVSHVLDVLDWGYGNVPAFIMKKAAKYGTGFHQLMDKKAKGERSRVTKQFKVRADAIEKWLKDNNYKIKESEIRLKYISDFGDVYGYEAPKGYQGTCDGVLEDLKGNLILIDWKTGRVTKRHYLQCSAYKMAYEQQTGRKIDRIIIVKPTTKGLVEEYDLDKSPEYYGKVFLRLLNKYYATKKS